MARRHKTLLCVDDDQASLKICKIILEDFGYKVLTASSGRECELVAAEMKRANPRIPILMLSGCVSLPESALLLVDEFVPKGDPVEFLLLAVRQVLSRGEKRKPVGAVTQSRVAPKARIVVVQ